MYIYWTSTTFTFCPCFLIPTMQLNKFIFKSSFYFLSEVPHLVLMCLWVSAMLASEIPSDRSVSDQISPHEFLFFL